MKHAFLILHYGYNLAAVDELEQCTILACVESSLELHFAFADDQATAC